MSNKILVVRRDNIGDLVCTTPVIAALRSRFPEARICALVNSYNLPVLENNPDIDEVFAYTKAKHRPPGKSIIANYWDRFRLLLRLRRERFDYAIIAAPGFWPRVVRTLSWIKTRHIIGFTEEGRPGIEHIDMAVPYSRERPMHEVEDIFRLLAPLGIQSPPPPARLTPSPSKVMRAQQKLKQHGLLAARMLLGVHISARKPSQRWPVEKFIELIKKLHEKYDANFVLLWSPGGADNPMHPGDDSNAQAIMTQLAGFPIIAYPTGDLGDLIGALSLCNEVICSDGGAMHIAAALGKPIVCFFGKSDVTRWHPWGVPYELLQPRSLDVKDISVGEVMVAFEHLLTKTLFS
jgi:ADP-heptose:LPS heptosyltransferase